MDSSLKYIHNSQHGHNSDKRKRVKTCNSVLRKVSVQEYIMQIYLNQTSANTYLFNRYKDKTHRQVIYHRNQPNSKGVNVLV